MKINRLSKREAVITVFAAIILAGLQVLGYSFSKQNNWNLFFEHGKIHWKSAILWLLLSIIFYICILLFFRLLDYNKKNLYENEKYKITVRKIFKLSCIFLICWLPYIIISYPCAANPDVRDQLGQIFHDSSMCWTRKYVNLPNPDISYWNNHHPVGHTLVISIFANIGKIVHSVRFGLFLMMLTQMILMALLFSYIICYLRKRQASKITIGFAVLFYAFWPLVPLTTASLCKDTLFSVFILTATIFLVEMFRAPQKFFEKKKNIIGLITIFILQGLMRNNGLYLLILVFPIAFILGKNVRKYVCISFLIPILLLGIIVPKGIFKAAGIAPGSEKEMLSVPLQQIARLLKEHDSQISDKDKKIIEHVMCPGENYTVLVKRYNPRQSDPVKNSYNLNLTTKEKTAFFRIWYKYLKIYPSVYIQAAMNNCYEYFYYERYGRETYYNGIQVEGKPFLGITNIKQFEKVRDNLSDVMQRIQRNPFTGWVINIGFYMNVLIILLMYCLIKRRYRLFWAYGLIMANILISLIGPIVYMRYAYYFIISIPFLLGLINCKEVRETDEIYEN